MKKHFLAQYVILHWIPFAVAIVLLSITVYLGIQQTIRISANTPQVQVSEDTAVELKNGIITLSTIASQRQIDFSRSLATYVIVYNQNGQPLASTGTIGNTVPNMLPSVISYVKDNGEDIFTWQPQAGTRSAVVINDYTSHGVTYYVLAGRSLRDVELSESLIEKDIAIACLGSLLVMFLSIAALAYTKDLLEARENFLRESEKK